MPATKWNDSYIGKKYGYLTILGLSAYKDNSKALKVFCKCQCGKIIEPNFHILIGKNQKSCGCHSKGQLIHGASTTKLYQKWANMLRRCNNPNDISYKNYGGRGIKVCKEWHNFLIFKFQMRKKYLDTKNKYEGKKISIERINNNDGYYFNNCIFILHKFQNRHRRNIYPVKAINRKTGEEVYKKTQKELAKKINLSYDHVHKVLKGKKRSKEWIIRPLLNPQ